MWDWWRWDAMKSRSRGVNEHLQTRLVRCTHDCFQELRGA